MLRAPAAVGAAVGCDRLAAAVHLVLFVHRVDGLTPGVYAYLRDPAAERELRAAMRPEFLWERVHDAMPDLFLLLPTDVTWVANRLSCDQDIAGDGLLQPRHARAVRAAAGRDAASGCTGGSSGSAG